MRPDDKQIADAARAYATLWAKREEMLAMARERRYDTLEPEEQARFNELREEWLKAHDTLVKAALESCS